MVPTSKSGKLTTGSLNFKKCLKAGSSNATFCNQGYPATVPCTDLHFPHRTYSDVLDEDGSILMANVLPFGSLPHLLQGVEEGYLVDNVGESKGGFGFPIRSDSELGLNKDKDIGDAPPEMFEDVLECESNGPPLIAADDDYRDGENSTAKYPVLLSPDPALTFCDTDLEQVDWNTLIYRPQNPPQKYAELACIFNRSAKGSGQISEVTTEGANVNHCNLHGDGDVGRSNMQKHTFIRDTNAEQTDRDTEIYAPQKYAELACIFKRSAAGPAESSSSQTTEVTAVEGANVKQMSITNSQEGNLIEESIWKDGHAGGYHPNLQSGSDNEEFHYSEVHEVLTSDKDCGGKVSRRSGMVTVSDFVKSSSLGCSIGIDTLQRVFKPVHCLDTISSPEEINSNNSNNPKDSNGDNSNRSQKMKKLLRRTSRRLPKESRYILNRWLRENLQAPFPTRQEKENLALQAGLKFKQVVSWMAYTRKKLGLS